MELVADFDRSPPNAPRVDFRRFAIHPVAVVSPLAGGVLTRDKPPLQFSSLGVRYLGLIFVILFPWRPSPAISPFWSKIKA
jgi:hypothetical protein